MPEPRPEIPGSSVFSVAEITARLKELLEQNFSNIWVEGEISNHARPSSGHEYFTLKDAGSSLKAALYRNYRNRLKFQLSDGLKVLARGRISIFPPRGEYQLLVEDVVPQGIGPLELAFQQLREKLSKKGYFAPERKRPIPRMPRRIALVTSPTGSAVRDVLELLSRRWPSLEVWVAPVMVQGEEAAPMIARMLALLNQCNARNREGELDLILLVRGGGSLEDLWPFNEEVVASAIFESRIPVVTGIGHEDDLTIADLVADRRALTPSEAAELSSPSRVEIRNNLRSTQDRLGLHLRRKLELGAAQLARLSGRACFRRPMERIRERERRIEDLQEKLKRNIRAVLEINKTQFL
ncbi:MAG: exodeoxyribonuclease VII large subunit, partial [Gemmataceae bacterium]